MDRFRALFDNNPAAIIEIAADGRIAAVNDAACLLLGYDRRELVGQGFEMLVSPGRVALASARVREMMKGSTRGIEGWLCCKNGAEWLADITPIPVRDGANVTSVFLRCRDLAPEQALANRLSENDERLRGFYRLVSSSANSGLMIDEALRFGVRALRMSYGFVARVDGEVVTFLHRYGPGELHPIGYHMPASAAIGRRLAASPRPQAVEDLTVEPYAGELRGRGLPWKSFIGSRIAVDGIPFGLLIFLDESVRAEPFQEADLDFLELMSGLVGAAVSREINEKKLEEFASNDALTGLPNRRYLEAYAAQTIADAARSGASVAVHYVDLDEFKPINDRYGHAAGDAVLCEVVRRLSAALRTHDFFARVGGDEFIIVQTALAEEASVATLTRRLIDAMEANVLLPSGEAIAVSASFGSAIYPRDGATFGELVALADAAMFTNKERRYTAKNEQRRSL